jgi:hypothetical protein
MEGQQSELELARQSTTLRFVGTGSNGYNDIHDFEMPGTPYLIALHENMETHKLYAVWVDPRKRQSRDGHYPHLPTIFDSLPSEIQQELLRLRPLFSRRLGPNAVGEFDVLAERG